MQPRNSYSSIAKELNNESRFYSELSLGRNQGGTSQRSVQADDPKDNREEVQERRSETNAAVGHGMHAMTDYCVGHNVLVSELTNIAQARFNAEAGLLREGICWSLL